MNIINPYHKCGKWLKGNFHAHSTNSACGRFPVESVYDAYSDYDFFSISDHDQITDILNNKTSATVFEAIEVTAPSRHMLLVNPSKMIMNNYSNKFSINHFTQLSKNCVEKGGISILCHPNRTTGAYWEIEDMYNMEGYTGIEILSGYGDNIQLDVACDKWDMLLSKGYRVWGFGNDDFHKFGQERRVWNVVLAKDNSRETIISSIKSGSFYVSKGYGFNSIIENDDKITVILPNDPLMDCMYKYIAFIGENGSLLYEKSGIFNSAEYICKGNERYVRIAAYLEGGYCAYSQPLFVEK